MKLKFKLSLFNLLSKLIFTGLFILLMPYIIERINLRQIDNSLVQKRENVLSMISEIGIEPFISSDSSFGSFNILKEEYISLEMSDSKDDFNFITEDSRLMDDEEIDYRVLHYSFFIDDQKYVLEVGKSLESIAETGKNTRNVMMLFLGLIVLITFITDIQYTRIILTPLDKIKDKLRLISDPAQFDKVPVKTSTSDFVRLDKALCEVMENLNSLFIKEKEITVNISHELMTPVSVLRSKLENLMMKDDLHPGFAEKIEDSLKTLHRLQSLVNSLLMIARIESNQYLREDSFSIAGLLQDIKKELEPIALDSCVNLISELKDDLHLNNANRSLLFSMFYNVVNNALKNTPLGGSVVISSSKEGSNLTVTIADTGRGLTAEQKKNLFSRFRTRDKNSGEGTGIGLAIAKTIADFHNTEVQVASELEKGTKFVFVFSENS